MIRAISERVLMGGDDDAAEDEDQLYAETPARWHPSAAEIAHLDVCTLEGYVSEPCAEELSSFSSACSHCSKAHLT